MGSAQGMIMASPSFFLHDAQFILQWDERLFFGATCTPAFALDQNIGVP
jgi:hypothetical protein